MVAAEATVPGTPNKTAGMVSEVADTADRPIKNASAVNGSMEKVKGSSRDRPTKPPSPGITPRINPMKTPRARKPKRSGSLSATAAFTAMSNISSNIYSPEVSPGGTP